MKIVLWIGNEANQKALANKINNYFSIEGIVIETRDYKPKITFIKIFEKIIEKIFLSSVEKSWSDMKTYFAKKFLSYPATNLIDVENINSKTAFDFTKEINPDLIVVSGTRMITEKMLSLKTTLGILNLHTGLSPYIKGGPNCTNWCIANKQFHLIGNTVMWIDLGIDAGNIITTEFTNFNGDEDLTNIHIKVMEHAHILYFKAISYVINGGNSGVKQSSISDGITYYNKQWTLMKKIFLVYNLRKFRQVVKTGNINKLRETVKIIKI